MNVAIWKRYRAIVVQAYNVHRLAGYDHESVFAMIRRHYGTYGQELLEAVIASEGSGCVSAGRTCS